MTVPAEASEVEDFTPASLANLPAPPVFLLRAASGRDWRRYQYTLRAEGLEYHGSEAFRDEALRALRALWSDGDYEANAARLRAYWTLIDQGGEPEPADVSAGGLP